MVNGGNYFIIATIHTGSASGHGADTVDSICVDGLYTFT
jgi:hypothetical protein